MECLLLGNPIDVTNIGLVYPVKLKDHDKFSSYAWTCVTTKKSLNRENEDTGLLTMLIFDNLEAEEEIMRGAFVAFLSELIKIVTKEDRVEFLQETMGFIIGEKTIEIIDGKEVEFESERFLNDSNFEEFRKVVAEQNILHEKRYYKPFLKKMIDDMRKTKLKTKNTLSFESILSVLSIEMGVNYEFLNELTYMQAITNFQRLCMKENYISSLLHRVSGNFKDIKIDDYLKDIDLFKHPDDELLGKGNPLGGKLKL